jgi:hypothetical protein
VESIVRLLEEIRRLAFGKLDHREIAQRIRDLFRDYDHPEANE